jgi:putative hydrolase of the HAD superfamily
LAEYAWVISFLLFDLDNTLYSASSGMFDYMREGMSAFVSELLNVDMEEATLLRRRNSRRYGSTLRWLKATQEEIDIESFLERIHPVNVANYLTYSEEPRKVLSEIPIPKGVLTNSPIEHAERVLDFFGISDLFDFVLDLRADNFNGKPDRSAYDRAIETAAVPVEQILYLDDVLHYLEPFREIGGQVVLVDELNRFDGEAEEIPRLRSIRELPRFLTRRLHA